MGVPVSQMHGVLLGGIDPSIIRELSGVYKPFVKAFKELVSNSFDADADNVTVDLAPDFSTISVRDDGAGMSPFEFRGEFTRIGGGSRRWLGDKTAKGRLRIGSKGIGFLALARYCERLEVESASARTFITKLTIPKTPARVDLRTALGIPLSAETLKGRLSCGIRQTRGKLKALRRDTHYRLDVQNQQVHITRRMGPVEVTLKVNCYGLAFKAILDFGRLLELADRADLETVTDFIQVAVFQGDANGTVVTALDLKSFVRNDLRRGQRRGYVRNIASRSGVERFQWELSRSTPVAYSEAIPDAPENLRRLLQVPATSTLKRLEFRCGEIHRELRRPLGILGEDSLPLSDEMLVEVTLDEDGLQASGFVAGFEQVIFPAEHRGITLRVRGVAIGDPNFLGAESLVTGASRAALSQITGEVNVLAGLDAVDALNPGRESFYEESEHFKTMRRLMVGEGERVGGYLGDAIARVLRRSQVRSSVKDVLGRATLRRRVLDDLAAGVLDLIVSGGPASAVLRKFLASTKSTVNGLEACPGFTVSVPPRIGGMKVLLEKGLSGPFEADYGTQLLRLDTGRPEWDWSLVLFDRRFAVINKRGGAHLPLVEVDLKDSRILLNWEHPIRVQMDERSFLRTALAWGLAREAGASNPDSMMDLALQLLAFRTDSIRG